MKKFTWNDITIAQFDLINDIINDDTLEEVDKQLQIMAILWNCDAEELEKLTIPEYTKKTYRMNIFGTTITPNKIRRVYEVDGKEYRLTKDIDRFTTGQFIDYCNFAKEGINIKNTSKLVGVLLNCDDYDAIYRTMSVADAYGIVNFLSASLNRSLRRSTDYSMAMKIAESPITMKDKIKMMWNLTRLKNRVFQNMES